jgi:hypothetical protein
MSYSELADFNRGAKEPQNCVPFAPQIGEPHIKVASGSPQNYACVSDPGFEVKTSDITAAWAAGSGAGKMFTDRDRRWHVEKLAQNTLLFVG